MSLKSSEEYVADNGLGCINCDSSDLHVGVARIYGTELHQRVTCENCETEWTDVFTLNRYIDAYEGLDV